MKKTLKKLFFFFFTLAMLLSVTGCGSDTPSADSGGADTANVEGDLDWPKEPIKIICPYTAGGGSDLMSRIVADQLSQMLGVAVYVEDLPGGSGAVGMSSLATSEPDGYTIGMAALGACTITPIMSETGYDNTSFAPISQVTMVPNCFVISSELGISTWEELLEYAETNGPIQYGCSGASAPQYINMVNLTGSIGKQDLFTLIPFEGGAASVTALLGNQIDASVNIISEPYPYVEDGTFTALWVTEATDYMPDVPTTEELGMDGGFGLWYGFAAPAGTDERILDKLDACISEIMEMDTVKEQFDNIGQPAVYADRETFTATWQQSWEENSATLDELGLSIH